MCSSAHACPHIALLVYPHVQKAALYGLEDLFSLAASMATAQEPALPVADLSLLDLTPTGNAAEKGHDILYTFIVIPPSFTNPDPTCIPPHIQTWLRARHQSGSVLCSICAGAFLLAGSGLLDGRSATTHWELRDIFRRTYPKVALDIDRLIIDEGDIITAGGLMAWVDLGLILIERLYGRTIMLEVARIFLVDPVERAQSQYARFTPYLAHGNRAILAVQHWLQKHFREPISVDDMAGKATMTKRTFLRHFFKATGYKPAEYLQRLRIAAAQDALEQTTRSINEIAWASGYLDVVAFGRTFQKHVGLTPAKYRQRFAVVRPAQSRI